MSTVFFHSQECHSFVRTRSTWSNFRTCWNEPQPSSKSTTGPPNSVGSSAGRRRKRGREMKCVCVCMHSLNGFISGCCSEKPLIPLWLTKYLLLITFIWQVSLLLLLRSLFVYTSSHPLTVPRLHSLTRVYSHIPHSTTYPHL